MGLTLKVLSPRYVSIRQCIPFYATHCSKIKTTIIKARNLLKEPKSYPCCPLSLSHYEKNIEAPNTKVWSKAQS